MTLTVPTWLTLLRIVLIPVLVLVFYLPYTWTNFAAAFIFILAAVTDWLDGWIARRYHLYSAFGAFLDPVADKLMVAVSLFLIVQDNPTMWMAIWAAVIVGREIEAKQVGIDARTHAGVRGGEDRERRRHHRVSAAPRRDLDTERDRRGAESERHLLAARRAAEQAGEMSQPLGA